MRRRPEMLKFGICFSKEFEGVEPLSHIGKKLPVYLHLLELCQKEGWETYVLTRKTYVGESTFNGVWLYKNNMFEQIKSKTKIDIIYDRTGGVAFPPQEEKRVVNNREFKLLCWNKWEAYKKIGEYMPKTFWVGSDKSKLAEILDNIDTDLVVLKPFNGLKGIGVFIGKKDKALEIDFEGRDYIAQEFVDTSAGIDGGIVGYHDLRVAIVNNKIVWSHVRTPVEGSLAANVAQGGKLIEMDINKIPVRVKDIVKEISNIFYEKYENPSYSLDFGIEKGKPVIFEINDQIGFPLWEMENRDTFLRELVSSFRLFVNGKN